MKLIKTLQIQLVAFGIALASSCNTPNTKNNLEQTKSTEPAEAIETASLTEGQQHAAKKVNDLANKYLYAFTNIDSDLPPMQIEINGFKNQMHGLDSTIASTQTNPQTAEAIKAIYKANGVKPGQAENCPLEKMKAIAMEVNDAFTNKKIQ